VFYENGLSNESPDLKPEADLFRFDVTATSTTWTNRSANMPDISGGNLSGSDPLAVQNGYNMLVAVKPNDPNIVSLAAPTCTAPPMASLLRQIQHGSMDIIQTLLTSNIQMVMPISIYLPSILLIQIQPL
jgi:hypothetical protein